MPLPTTALACEEEVLDAANDWTLVMNAEVAGKFLFVSDWQCALNKSTKELCSILRIPLRSRILRKLTSERSPI